MRLSLGVVLVLSWFIASNHQTEAGITKTLNYQGQLKNGSGVLVSDGAYSMTIRLYDAASGGNCLWSARGTCGSPTTRSVSVTNGIFSVVLGDTGAGDNAINLDFSGSYYLSVMISPDATELSPRKPITSVPQAFTSNNTIGDGRIELTNILAGTEALDISYNPSSGSASAAVISYGSGGGTGSALKVTQSGTGNIFEAYDATNLAMVIRDGGNVGIGTTAPGSYKLNVNGNSNITGNLDVSSGIDVSGGSSLTLADAANFDINSSISSDVNNYGVFDIGVTNTAATSANTQAGLRIALESGSTQLLDAGIRILDNSASAGADITDAIQISAAPSAYILSTPSLDITGAGAISGATGVSSSGTITFSGLATAGLVTNTAGGVLGTTTTIGSAYITDDSLDFTKFEDTLDADANVTVNQGTYTWAQNFTGTTTTGYTYTADSLTTGTGMLLTSSSITSGNLFNVRYYNTTDTAAFSGNVGVFSMTSTWTGASSPTNSGNMIEAARAITMNSLGYNNTISGAVLRVSDAATLTAGTITHSANTLEIVQSYTANTGSALNVTTAGTGYALRVNDDGTLTDASPFVVDSAGNVGIGTTDPGSYKLNVAGNINASSINATNYYVGGSPMATLSAGTVTGQTLYWNGSSWTSSVNLFNNNTNVGIGTTNPSLATLQVIGSGYFSTGLTVPAGGVTITGASTITGALSGITTLGASGTVTFTNLTASRAVFTNGSSQLITSAASSVLANSITDETGGGSLVFGSSPTLSTLTVSSGGIAVTGNSTISGTLGSLTGLTVASGTVSLPSGQIDNAELAYSSVTLTAGSAMSGGGAVSLGSSVTLSHSDTSSQASSDNSSNTFIQDITLDAYGHLTGLATASVSFSGYANTALSNLSAVAINTSLLPGTTDSIDLGSDSYRWRDLYLGPDTLHIGTGTADEYAIAYDTTNNRLGFNVNGTGAAEIVMDSAGNVGIGTTNPSAKLEVNGGAYFTADGTAPTSGVTVYSHNINQYQGGLYLTNSTHWKTATAANYAFKIATIGTATTPLIRMGWAEATDPNTYLSDFVINNDGNVGIGVTNPIYRFVISAYTANDRGIYINHTAATGTNYGVYSSVTGAATSNIGGYFEATNAAINYGVRTANISSSTNSYGIYMGSLSGAGSASGIYMNNITNTGSYAYGINMAAISGANSVAQTQIDFGNISGGTLNTYGINMGTISGGTTANYAIRSAAITSTGATNSYGIYQQAISGSGTNVYGMLIAAPTATGTTAYGLRINGPTGAATNNYGLNVTVPTNATHNVGIEIGTPSTGAGTWALYSSSTSDSYVAGNVGIGTTNPSLAKLQVVGNSYLNGTVTAVTSVSSPIFQGISAAVTFGNASYGTTIAGSSLTVSPTAWTATPTISGLITATSGLTSTGTLTANGTLDANGVVTLGDNGDNVTIDSSVWDITAAGVVSGLTGLGSSGTISLTGDINIVEAAGHTVNISGTQPAAVGTTPATAAAEILDITAPTGGNTTIATTGVGGVGSGISWSMGTGGTAASAATSSTGGAGGAISFTAGAGGAAAAAGIDIGGAGGNIAFVGGAGGAATVGTSLTGGAGGYSGIFGGNAGAGGNANGGAVYVRPGAPTGTGTSVVYIGDSNATAIYIGNTTTNPAITLRGTGLTTIGGSLTVTGTAWTATPTISGLITATSGLTSTGTLTANGSLDANGAVTLGDNGDGVTIDSNTWNITSAGVASGLTGLTSSGTVTFSQLSVAGLVTNTAGGVLGTTATIGSAYITDDSLDFTKFEDTLDADANVTVNQSTYTWAQAFTGTTTTGYTYTADSLTTGTGMLLTTSSLTSGNLLNVRYYNTTDTVAFTGNVGLFSMTSTWTGASSPSNTGNMIEAARSITMNSLGYNNTISGAVLRVSDAATLTAGTITHSANALEVVQGYTANTGSALNVTTAGTGYALQVNDDGTLTDSTPFVVDATGSVGIGTTNAGTYKLNVVGSGYFSTGLTVPAGGVTITGASTITGALSGITTLGASGTVTFTNLTASRAVFTNASSQLITSAASSVIAASITDETGSGSLVFGTSPTLVSPTLITPNIGAATGTSLSLSATGDALTLSGAGANIYFSGAGLGQIRTIANQNLALMPGGTGNVGIGTTAPGAKLEVNGDILFSGGSARTISVGGAGTYDLTVSAASYGISGAGGALRLNGGSGLVGGDVFVDGGSGGSGTGDVNIASVYGNVGIGTSTPNYKLDVYGSFSDTLSGSETFIISGSSTTGAPILFAPTFKPSTDSFATALRGNVEPTGGITNFYGNDLRPSFRSSQNITNARAAFIRGDSTASQTGAITNFFALDVAPSPPSTWAGTAPTSWSQVRIGDVTVGSSAIYGLSSQITSGAGKFNIYASGTAYNYFAGNVGIGTTDPPYKLQITTSTANDRGINITHSAATGSNYGIYTSLTGAATANTGGYFEATNAATNYGVRTAAMSSSTANYGIYMGGLSGSGTASGIYMGSITSTGATAYGINMSAISGANATSQTQIDFGNISGGTLNTYGINMGTITGGTTANFAIRSAAITSTGAANSYGIYQQAISGTGNNVYGMYVVAPTATGTAAYGMRVGAPTGAATSNYGLNITQPTGATHDVALEIGTASTGAGDWAIYSSSTADSYFSGNVGIGTSAPSAKLEINNGTITTTGSGTQFFGQYATGDTAIRLGYARSADGSSYIDLIGDTTYTGYGLRLLRGSAGANANSYLMHRGTGSLMIQTDDSAPIRFLTSSSDRMVITSSGNVGISAGLTPLARVHATTTGAGEDVFFGEASSSGDVFVASATSGYGVNAYSSGSIGGFFSSGGGTALVAYTGNVGIGTSNPIYKVDINTSTANDRGIDITHSATTGTNYGVYSSVVGVGATYNYGGYFEALNASTQYGIYVMSMDASSTNTGGYFISTSAATNYGVRVGDMISSSNSYGIYLGNLSGTGSASGIYMGNITSTGSYAYGINMAAISGANSVAQTQIDFGNISGGTLNTYGINMGTITGGTTANYAIRSAAITSTGATNSYGIYQQAISGTGNNVYGMYVAASTTTGTAAYGMRILGPSGAATSNYGLNVTVPTNATHNSAITIGTPVTGAGTWALYSGAANNSYFAGNVGIGTSNPSSYNLQITGTFGLNGAITSTNTTATAMTFSGNGAGITFSGTGPNQIITASGVNLALMPGGTGNVGIGTTAPTVKLHVVSNTIRLNDNAASAPTRNNVGEIGLGATGTGAANGRIWIRAGVTATNFYFQSAGTGDFSEFFRAEDQSLETGEIVMYDEDNDKAVRRAEGEYSDQVVGVVARSGEGTQNNNDQDGNRESDPNYKNISLLGQTLVKVNDENGMIKKGDPITQSSTPGVGMKATLPGMVIGTALEDQSSAEDTIQAYIHVQYQGPKNTQLAFNELGYAGFGTANPTEKVEIVGNLRVTGGSIITDADSLAVPDYVFESGYQLRSLEQLENYIDTNSHLPGVASRSEIKKNGLNFGEMMMSILEKTEENTLYIIKNHKDIQEQAGLIVGQTKQITEQSTLIANLANTDLTVTEKVTMLDRGAEEAAAQLESLENTSEKQTSQLATLTKSLTQLTKEMEDLKTQNQAVIDFALALEPENLLYKDEEGNIDLAGKIKAQDVEVLGAMVAKDIEAETLKLEEGKTSGQDIIKAGETEITVETSDVSDNAKIYVTPKGSAHGKTLYFDDVVDGQSFKVKIDAPALNKDIQFNWLIIK